MSLSANDTELCEHDNEQTQQLSDFIHDLIQNENHISSQAKRFLMNNVDSTLSVLCKNGHFRSLFLTWTNLSPNQRSLLDEIALSKITTNYKFFVTLKVSVLVWEYIQDHYGAPGYDEEDKKGDLHQSDADVLNKVDKIIGWIVEKRNGNVRASRSALFLPRSDGFSEMDNS
ncbi:hypothetical protein WDU94_013287 [Cyamophila willieti]